MIFVALRVRSRAQVGESDVIVFHEGDLGPADADALSGSTQVRFCLLQKEMGWGRPRPGREPKGLPGRG